MGACVYAFRGIHAHTGSPKRVPIMDLFKTVSTSALQVTSIVVYIKYKT